jgi:hypothetical protein
MTSTTVQMGRSTCENRWQFIFIANNNVEKKKDKEKIADWD